MNKWQLTRQGHLDLREGTAAREGVTWTLEILLESLHLFLAARPVTGGLSCQVAAYCMKSVIAVKPEKAAEGKAVV